MEAESTHADGRVHGEGRFCQDQRGKMHDKKFLTHLNLGRCSMKERLQGVNL